MLRSTASSEWGLSRLRHYGATCSHVQQLLALPFLSDMLSTECTRRLLSGRGAAKEISEGMLRRYQKYNLNAMSHDAAIGLVQRAYEERRGALGPLHEDTCRTAESACTPGSTPA